MIDEKKKIRAVMVGCGGISNAWLQSITSGDDIEIVALVDLNRENAMDKKNKYNLSKAVVSSYLQAVIDDLHPDVVLDCTTPNVHSFVVKTALNAGCAVLGEKPMAENMQDAKEMVSLAKEKELLYAVIQNRRYDSNIQTYRQVLSSGEIGDLTTLNADFYIGAHFGGFRDEMEHVLLLDMAIHTFDQARYLSGADPVSVYAVDWNPKGSWYAHGASALAVFEMSDGSIFNYRGSWCSEGLNTSWESEWRAIGTKGTAVWDGNDSIKAQTVAKSEGFMSEMSDVDVSSYKVVLPEGRCAHGGVINDFVDAWRSGGQPMTAGTDNIKSLAMVQAAIESAETGQKVTINI